MSASGKFVLRLPPELHLHFQKQAKLQNISLNRLIVRCLQGPDVTKSMPLEVVDLIRKNFGESLLAILMFGSAVRGERRQDSDIDLLIVLDSAVAIERSLYTKWDKSVLPHLADDFSPQFVHLPQDEQISSLWLEVAMESEVLYDKTMEMKGRLLKIREQIAAGLYVRKLSHGHPYWISTQKAEG